MKTLESTILAVYGVTAIECDAITVEWGVAKFAEVVGECAAAKAWKRLNAKKNRLGKYTSIPRFGTPFYHYYFGRNETYPMVNGSTIG